MACSSPSAPLRVAPLASYIHNTCPLVGAGVMRPLGVLSFCGLTLPDLGGRDASQGSQGSKWLLRGAWARETSSYFHVGDALGVTL